MIAEPSAPALIELTDGERSLMLALALDLRAEAVAEGNRLLLTAAVAQARRMVLDERD